MKSYLNIVRDVLDHGQRQENRTGVDALVLPNVHFSHDMSEGFPLLTTKRMAFKTLSVELEGFIKGITSKKWYEDRGCMIWSAWSNPLAVQDIVDNQIEHGYSVNRQKIQRELDDLGPLGYAWEMRRFGEVYDEDDDGVMKGFDQFDYIIKTLKTNPNDRRMVCSAWNPNHLSRAALPSCHFAWCVTHINGVLNLHWTQRSCDLMLGVPFNIASYALLLSLLCKESGMTPGNLSGMLCNCHIYDNHTDAANIQLMRTARSLPSVEFPDWNGIYNWKHDHTELNNYNPYGKLKMEVAV
jgi:thymidylate synthase